MTTPNVDSSVAAFKRDRIQPAATITVDEISRLWQVHTIIDLVVHTIGDEETSERPAVVPALMAAMDLVLTTISELSAKEEDARKLS